MKRQEEGMAEHEEDHHLMSDVPLNDNTVKHHHHHPINNPFMYSPTTRKRRFLATAVFVLVGLIGSSIIMRSGSDATVAHSARPKIVDVNGPPEQIGNMTMEKTKKTKTKSSSKRKSKKNIFRLTDEEEDGTFVIVDQNDDEIPSGIFPSYQHAADALECRESVISFVINATDAKDECDGLKRAFDKTCNSDTAATSAAEAEVKAEQRRRRLFLETSQPDTIRQRWHALVFSTSRFITSYIRWMVVPESAVDFSSEEEIIGRAWDDALYLVESDLDAVVHDDLRRRLRKEEHERKLKEEKGLENNSTKKMEVDQQRKRNLEKEKSKEKVRSKEDKKGDGTKTATVDDEEYMGEDEGAVKDSEVPLTLAPTTSPSGGPTEQQAATKEPKVVPEKPKQSLTLPTSNQHISGQMLSETLLLQKEETIQEAIKVAANHTNGTRAEAEVDAAVSSKAVKDATDVVSAVLNDPTSVEARTCCASILNVFHENCDTPDQEVVSDRKLFLIVFVIALCGMVKSVIRFYQIRWLPEAAGCILVGVMCGSVMSVVPHYDISFDGDWFLRIMVPPIVFEAALSIDKRSFNRHIWPIMIYAVVGTLFATGLTAFILHKGTSMLQGCETVPFVESLTFGALISSIDPIAVLSVLNNMGMTDTDTIYVVIFGESLLNDGVALVLFQTLMHFLDESLVIDAEAVIAATIHFCVVAFGSLCVGVGSGIACSGYYWMMQGCQTPLVEVLLFFCWAFIPYYICDGIGWSGIVAVVATGFVMDLYVFGQGQDVEDPSSPRSRESDGKPPRRDLFTLQGHLSPLARTHVGFVAELLATMMETAIFAYLGVFLFSYRYHWNFYHTFLAIFACCISRAIMIPSLSLLANWVAKIQQARAICNRRKNRRGGGGALSAASAASAGEGGVTINGKMQLVLWVAGLRGAMSFALVENIPMYDTVTGEGSRVKPELKAMTSATIVFTVFVLGGYTYYLMEYLGMTPQQLPREQTTPLSSKKRTNSATYGTPTTSSFESDDGDRYPVRHRTKDKNHS